MPPSPYWPQELEFQISKILPGTSLASLDETDIETLLDFVFYINYQQKQDEEQFITINGKRYKKVTKFSTPM